MSSLAVMIKIYNKEFSFSYCLGIAVNGTESLLSSIFLLVVIIGNELTYPSIVLNAHTLDTISYIIRLGILIDHFDSRG